MRYAIFSDIHGNVQALRRVLLSLSVEDVDRYICAGDIVGYGACPNECVDLVRETGALCVCGNHDWGAIGLVQADYFNNAAREALLWTEEQLRPDAAGYLRSLPLIYQDSEVTVTHGSLREPEGFNYMSGQTEAEGTMSLSGTAVCFVGHTHIPAVFSEGGKGPNPFADKAEVTRDRKWVINVGSVGQPRDSDPRAAYVIYDSETRLAELRRIEYDIAAAQNKIMEAGLPKSLALRLEQGV